ncbi:MAG: four-carbon acid sugar kinase family protein [Clostridia bacterium]|nr:four-carbon acid sugar kinase family protein [Clostridia bacterium]
MNKKRIGVVADDITGSNDIGVMLAKNGFRVTVLSLEDEPVPADLADVDALVINTGSRLDAAPLAADKSARAAAFLRDNGCEMVYTKTCSVFRGNIGANFDAVQDVLGVRTSMVVAGFPRNGRTTVDGIHYLNGVPVSETNFANDPVTPLKYSRLSDLIGQQSSRPCRVFTHEWLDKPVDIRSAHLEELKAEAAYVIFDVRDQADLVTIADLIREERNICGASAVCEALPGAWNQVSPVEMYHADKKNEGVLILAGSLTPQTTRQIAEVEKAGVPAYVLNPALLLEDGERASAVNDAVAYAAKVLAEGKDVLLYAARDTTAVREKSARLGITDVDAGRCISLAFEAIARQVREATGLTRYLVAGGETSDSVSRGLGVRTMRIWQEIEPGVPVMTARTFAGDELALVFKSGSFGSDAFLLRAAQILRG